MLTAVILVFLSVIVFFPEHQVVIILTRLILITFLLLSLVLLFLLTLLLYVIEANYNLHFILYLSLFSSFFASYLLKSFINHTEYVSYFLLVFVKICHQIYYLLL